MVGARFSCPAASVPLEQPGFDLTLEWRRPLAWAPSSHCPAIPRPVWPDHTVL